MSKKGPKGNTLLEILSTSIRLGLTSFGGPAAHLGYFRNEYVERKKWLDEKNYADLVALCQFLPGPASSQVGIAIGMLRGGYWGGIVSWIGFTFPSVMALILFALFLSGNNVLNEGWLHGLKIVAVAVVAQAVMGMGKSLAPDVPRITIAILASALTLLWPSAWGQILIIAAAGIIGIWLYRNAKGNSQGQDIQFGLSRRIGMAALILFFLLLFGTPILAALIPSLQLTLFDTFYRAGSIVFGGGHVVLPLLEKEVVPTDLLSEGAFLAGYGAAQAVPGPLFTFSSYLGTAINGLKGGLLATIAVFLPSFLLVAGVLPFWNIIRRNTKVQHALMGVNAAVVGILLAALYNPVWTSTIHTNADFVFALICFFLLVYRKIAPWIVVIGAAGIGQLLF